MARPTKLNFNTHNKIITAIRAGNYIETAAAENNNGGEGMKSVFEIIKENGQWEKFQQEVKNQYTHKFFLYITCICKKCDIIV